MGQPLQLFFAGNFNQVPMIVGHNAYEGNILAYINLQTPPSAGLSDSAYNAIVQQSFGSFGIADQVLEWYSDIQIEEGNWIAYARAIGDFTITCGTKLLVQAAATSQNAIFAYIFQHSLVNWPAPFLNATHGVEREFYLKRNTWKNFKFFNNVEKQKFKFFK
jgi:carboxylesterase type B